MQLIDRDKLRSALENAIRSRDINRVYDRYFREGLIAAMLHLGNQPTFEERKHGHWELTEDTISCPFCDYWNLRKKEQRNGVYVYSKTPNYCPNCGAEMESTK